MGAPVGAKFDVLVAPSPTRSTSNLPTKHIASMSNSKTTLRGRDARDGQFTTVKEAREHKQTHVVERVPKPGYGDTKK